MNLKKPVVSATSIGWSPRRFTAWLGAELCSIYWLIPKAGLAGREGLLALTVHRQAACKPGMLRSSPKFLYSRSAGGKNTFVTIAVLALLGGQTTNAAEQCEIASEPKVIATGFQFVEGPLWSSKDSAWFFSDIPANTIFQLGSDLQATAYKKPSSYANGNVFDMRGNMVSARHDRKVSSTSANGKTVVIAETYGAKRLNSPNDLTIARDGSVWFSDPDFGITGYGPQKAEAEQPVRGIYRIKDQKVELMTGELGEPNGLAFSRDGKKLYAADSSVGAVFSFEVAADGRLSNKQPFASVTPKPGQTPNADGVKVDSAGHVWVAGPGAVGVFLPDGKLVCRLEIDAAHVSNLAFGGRDGRDVLVTAADRLLMIRIKPSVK